jgi:hypothetical protein
MRPLRRPFFDAIIQGRHEHAQAQVENMTKAQVHPCIHTCTYTNVLSAFFLSLFEFAILIK